jgi:hypothetical protein
LQTLAGTARERHAEDERDDDSGEHSSPLLVSKWHISFIALLDFVVGESSNSTTPFEDANLCIPCFRLPPFKIAERFENERLRHREQMNIALEQMKADLESWRSGSSIKERMVAYLFPEVRKHISRVSESCLISSI